MAGKIGDRLNRMFSPTGRLMNLIGRVFDYILVGVFWILGSLPIVTVGASTAALYSMVLRMQRGEDDKLLREFIAAFRENFRQGSLLWLMQLLLGAFLALDIYFYLLWAAAGEIVGMILLAAFLLATVAYCGTFLYVYGYIARFRCAIPGAVRNCFLLSMRHFPYTLLMLASEAAFTVLGFLTGAGLLAIPAATAYVHGLCLERVFQKYIPKREHEELE